MKFTRFAFFFCLLSASFNFVGGQSAAHLKHHHPLPLSLCNVKAGSSTDAMVTSLYGEGFFDKNDGHGGARYYTDEAKKIILKTVIGVDHIIENVGVCSYKLPFDFVKDKLQSIPAAKKLNASSIMMGNIHIGDKAEKIVLQFGDPNKIEKVNDMRKLSYEDTKDEWKDILSYSASFEFRDDRLERIIIHNGE